MYTDSLLFDLLVIIGCTFLLIRFGKLRHSHPAVIYLIYHIYAITSRLMALNSGAPPIFGWGITLEVRPEEIIRAVLIEDLVFITMTIAWLRVAQRQTLLLAHSEMRQITSLNKNNILVVAFITIPIGLIVMAAAGDIPLLSFGSTSVYDLSTSNYVYIANNFFGFAMIGLLYWYGFKPLIVMPLALWELSLVFTGDERFKLIFR